MDSIDFCEKDVKNIHHWSKVGVEQEMIIYQCSQCRKCAFEPIRMIGNLFQKERNIKRHILTLH